jgi:hypothetical protein
MIVHLLSLLIERSPSNGQTPEALGEVFGPLLLRRGDAEAARTPRAPSGAAAAHERTAAAHIVRMLIVDKAYLFPDSEADTSTAALFTAPTPRGGDGGTTPGRRRTGSSGDATHRSSGEATHRSSGGGHTTPGRRRAGSGSQLALPSWAAEEMASESYAEMQAQRRAAAAEAERRRERDAHAVKRQRREHLSHAHSHSHSRARSPGRSMPDQALYALLLRCTAPPARMHLRACSVLTFFAIVFLYFALSPQRLCAW